MTAPHLPYACTSPSRVLPKLQPPKGDVGPSAVHPAQQRTAMVMPANELREVVDEVNQRRLQNPIRILLSNRRTSIRFHKAAFSLLPFPWVGYDGHLSAALWRDQNLTGLSFVQQKPPHAVCEPCNEPQRVKERDQREVYFDCDHDREVKRTRREFCAA